jgi:hypothetical protein
VRRGKTKKLKMAVALATRGMNIEDFEADLDEFTMHVKETEKLWAATNFPDPEKK